MTLSRRAFSLSALATTVAGTTSSHAAPTDPDVVVIGAGAAGLAATDALIRAGKTVICIEAADRIGGRAHTDTRVFGVPFDMGAHWLHTKSKNPFVSFGKKLGLDIYAAPDNFAAFTDGKPASRSDISAFYKAYSRMERKIGLAGALGRDVSAGSVVSTKGDWDITARMLIGSLSMARDLDRVSTADFNSAEGGSDMFCRQGFGRLLHDKWAGVPVSLNTAATEIIRTKDGVQVKTSRGTITAKAAIVTVSQGMLASGTIRFKPGFDTAHSKAIAGINMGTYNHIAMLFRDNALGVEPDTWITNRVTDTHNGSPKGGGMLANISGTGLTSFEVGGAFGRSLEKAGSAASIDLAVQEVSRLFGTDTRKSLVKAHATAWGNNRWIRGSYSGADPGAAALRDTLTKPHAQVIFLAGEATNTGLQATVAGAHKEGLRAAKQVAKLI